MTIQHATHVRDLTVRGRLIDMIAVPFDSPEWVEGPHGHYREAFTPGAFRKFQREDRWHRVHLRYEHRDGVPFGRAVNLTDDGAYLRATMKVTQDQAEADRLLAQVKDGDIHGVSIGFVPGDSVDDMDADGPLVRRVTVRHLAEISLTETPVYKDAQVVAVRAEQARRRADMLAWIESQRRDIL